MQASPMERKFPAGNPLFPNAGSQEEASAFLVYLFAPGTMISRDETRVLTGNVEIALRIKCQVKRMIDARIHLSVSLYEDLSEVVLSILIEGAVEL